MENGGSRICFSGWRCGNRIERPADVEINLPSLRKHFRGIMCTG